jgi:hypothetical protein
LASIPALREDQSIRPMLPRTSLSAPPAIAVPREPSKDDAAPRYGEERARDRQLALDKLNGGNSSGPTLTDLPPSRFLRGTATRHLSAPPLTISASTTQRAPRRSGGRDQAADKTRTRAGHQSTSDCSVM